MTMREAAEKVLGTGTYDCALPQTWLDRTAEGIGGDERKARCLMYQSILANFVWAYDEHAPVFGRPCALTEEGNLLLLAINAAMGSDYPLTPNPVGDEGEGI